MNKDQIFTAWAPDASIWSPWTKPVLFAHMGATAMAVPEWAQTPEAPVNINWCPAIQEKIAMVVDLPDAEGVLAGVALAERGYRPVPLYNAIPLPANEPTVDPISQREVAAVNVFPILDALRKGAERLAGLQIPADAPPAFLLDANRRAPGRQMAPDEFDNRSVCFTTDFPSANFLSGHGFQRAWLVQKDGPVRSDLSYVLRRWQDGGIALEIVRPGSSALPERLEIPRPSWYGAMFQRVLLAFGLARADEGGFGAWIPESAAGG